MYVYTLRLEGDKFYVGLTRNPVARLAQHRNGTGSRWTSKYKPQGFSGLRQAPDDPRRARLEEDMQTKYMMMVHGIQRVRGGTYSKIYLNNEEVGSIRRELWHATGACVGCGSTSHWVRDCPDASGRGDVDKDDAGTDPGEDESSDDSFVTAPDFDDDDNEGEWLL